MKRTGAEVVLKMRDEMLKLVACYNAIGAYEDAARAQTMAQALHKFEGALILTNMAWPPRIVGDAGSVRIKEADANHGFEGLTE